MAVGNRVTQGESQQNHARAAGLDLRRPITLRDVERRRTQLWSASFFTFLGVAAIAALYWGAYDLLPSSLQFAGTSTYVIAVLIGGLVLALTLYVVDKERRLRVLTRMLIAERERVARLEELDHVRNDFVASISHELRTPLTGIIGAAKMLGRGGPGMAPERFAEFITMIERQGDRLLRLVDDVLTTAQIESGPARLGREIVELGDLAYEVAADFAHTAVGLDRKIVVMTDPHRPRTWGDGSALRHVLSNLVENALKYAPDPAVVTVKMTETDAESRIEVHDNGPGIPADELEKIFDRFSQVDSSPAPRAGGYGLGLFIVKKIVDAHGGHIDVVSHVGQGTTFTVHLPKRASDQGKLIEPTVDRS